ncbi:U7 snRNA-associated Sm LSm11-like protein [Daphnia magna]|uniref:U7 snRNA-associated Sm LSm11-like protein n=1 Tax=Daphnia magna TaxID=35525 RepID=A0A164STK7_9CRUS|nr:U7 snRNA-associated Sm LSm11-like protein [Daphnia magna]
MEKQKEELDFSSTEFNALEALTSPNVTVPIPDAPMYNNLGQFISTINRARARQAQGDGAGPSTRDTINTLNSLNPLKRRFLPHQVISRIFFSAMLQRDLGRKPSSFTKPARLTRFCCFVYGHTAGSVRATIGTDSQSKKKKKEKGGGIEKQNKKSKSAGGVLVGRRLQYTVGREDRATLAHLLVTTSSLSFCNLQISQMVAMVKHSIEFLCQSSTRPCREKYSE